MVLIDHGRRQMVLTSKGVTENENTGTGVKEKLSHRTIPGYIKHLLAQVFSVFKCKPQSFRDLYQGNLNVGSLQASGLLAAARRYCFKQQYGSLQLEF